MHRCTETPTYSNYAMLGWGFQVSCSRSRKHTTVQTFTFASLAKARRISQYRAFVSSGIASQYVSQIITNQSSAILQDDGTKSTPSKPHKPLKAGCLQPILFCSCCIVKSRIIMTHSGTSSRFDGRAGAYAAFTVAGAHRKDGQCNCNHPSANITGS